MFLSTIIPTIGRQSLSRAVESVLNQDFTTDDFEVIVVNDTGEQLPLADWQRSQRVQIINTNRHNRSVARNAGAAIAKGKYLHFLDDDDWLLPGALASFWELEKGSQAAWLYGGFSLINNNGEVIFNVQPEETGNCYIHMISWEWLPLQSSIIESQAFFNVGGFASLQSLSGGFEDIDLSRQLALSYDFAGTSKIVACIRAGEQSSTTNYADMFIQNRRSREKALNMPGAFSRMKASADGSLMQSGYWYGKIAYYYLASIRWHLRQRRLFTAVGRSAYALASFAAAREFLLSTDFWRGLVRPHHSRTGNALRETGVYHLYASSISERT